MTCECSVKSVCEQSALQLLLDEPPLFSQDTGGAKIKRVKYGFIRALVRIHSILCTLFHFEIEAKKITRVLQGPESMILNDITREVLVTTHCTRTRHVTCDDAGPSDGEARLNPLGEGSSRLV